MTSPRHRILIVEFAMAATLAAALAEAGMEVVESAGGRGAVPLPHALCDDMPLVTLGAAARDAAPAPAHLRAVPPRMMRIKNYRSPRQRFDNVLKVKR